MGIYSTHTNNWFLPDIDGHIEQFIRNSVEHELERGMGAFEYEQIVGDFSEVTDEIRWHLNEELDDIIYFWEEYVESKNRKA